MTTDALVQLTHVNKHYGENHVLKDINLSIGKGEVVVLLGPSGSGKSTLCRTINRLETITDGNITIDGKKLPEEGKELSNLRAEVGMVFQSFSLFAHKTILENVTLGPRKVRGIGKYSSEVQLVQQNSCSDCVVALNAAINKMVETGAWEEAIEKNVGAANYTYDVIGAFWTNVQLTFWAAIGSFVFGSLSLSTL